MIFHVSIFAMNKRIQNEEKERKKKDFFFLGFFHTWHEIRNTVTYSHLIQIIISVYIYQFNMKNAIYRQR